MNIEKFKAIYSEHGNGCNGFFRHPLVRRFQYSDGVKDLAEEGCYWLLDIAATELPTAMRKAGEPHCILTVTVKSSKATLELSPTDNRTIWTKKIDWTDLPEGQWCFEVVDEGERVAINLISEH